ncbi:hypothetical protein BC939DRAFT_465180 [Gamsiella multidivaricata]|uniref:uncharacterized protein n=1 Tax=Gamsiella multidivaricata TaxID=101098 RepID=UPI00221E6DCD|nr:uncharacterized protein BC939DRAFT_465180 [Gamsiella multidivaricata]KAI7817659.1 hypothetical protein BC939DRAFT_465180 [Gamsiella multidivaricata]
MQEMKVGPSTAKEHLLRPQSGQKMKLKEKFVQIYDMFLRGQDPAQGRDPDVFWDELFLIKVNEEYLSSSLAQTSEDQLLAIKDGINGIFLHAVQAIRDPLPQRRLHAMQTLTIVLGEIFRKKFHNWSFDVIHLLTGLSHADLVFRTLIQGLSTILGSDEPLKLQVVALRLAIALACGNDNVNKNTLNEYFMQKDIFPSLIKFFVMVDSVDLAFEAMALLGLLANYNKYEIQNPYLASLAALKDEAVLQKMSMVIVQVFDGMRKGYTGVMDDDELSAVSKLTSALSYVTGMLWNPNAQDISVTDASFALLPDGRVTVLLIFYDLIYTNKRFQQVFLSYSTTAANSQDKQAEHLNLETSETGLGSFLSFSSYLLQHNRTQRSTPYTHLCLIIMLVLVEDPTTYPHLCSIPQSQDPPSLLVTPAGNTVNSMVTVRLCRQRQPVLPKVKQARPMAAVLLDVILGFLKHNMKKKMQIDCFRIAIAIIFSLTSRFKALRVRLPYHWVEMWNTLQGVVKFLQSNGKILQNHPDARDLVAETIDLVNYCVTFGDLIMPDPASLYALYYEIVRSGIDPYTDLTKQFFISVQPPLPPPLPHHDLTSRNRLNLATPVTTPPESALSSPSPASASIMGSPPPSPFQSYRSGSPLNAVGAVSAHQRLIIIDLSNINQVYTFFFTHLLTWRDANPTRSLGPDLVSTIIKNHYQDLTLIPIPLDSFLSQRQSNVPLGLKGYSGNNGRASPAPAGTSSPHPAWDGYSEVPAKVHFFRQLTRWVVADLRAISKQNAAVASGAAQPTSTTP